MKELTEQECVSCGIAFTAEKPEYCCSGGDCGCLGMPIYPPLCVSCEREFYGVDE